MAVPAAGDLEPHDDGSGGEVAEPFAVGDRTTVTRPTRYVWQRRRRGARSARAHAGT
jgi:hypothetical protein